MATNGGGRNADQKEEQSELEKLKNLGQLLLKTFRNEIENIQQALETFKMMLMKYATDKYPEDCMEYLKNNLLEELTKKLMERKHSYFRYDFNMADTFAECCRQLARIAIPLVREDDELGSEILYHVLNPRMCFYQQFGHDWRQRRGSELSKEETESNSEWRESIQEGVQVDYLTQNRWKLGTIKNITTKENDKGESYHILEILPDAPDIYNGNYRNQARHNSENDEWEFTDDFTYCQRTLCQIAPPLTKSVEKVPHMCKFRRELKTDDKCDCVDSVHKWYVCTVVQVNDARNTIQVHYDGWGTKYDEWVPRDNPRLQPPYKVAKGGKESGGVPGQWTDLEPIIEDDDDPDDVYAVWRGRIASVSYHLVDVMNDFGKNGGFDALLERLANHKPNMKVKHLRFIVSAISKCYKMFTQKYATSILKRMQELTYETLESLSDVELRDLKKEYLDKIISSCDEMLGRFHEYKETQAISEVFQLTMALKRLKSASIERRVNGVQYIANVCNRTSKHMRYWYHVDVELLTKWIEENHLLEVLFGSKSHPQLMKQSEEILKFLCKEAELTDDHLNVVWNAIERAASKIDDVDNELETICSLIDNLKIWLKPNHFDYLFQKFEEIDVKKLTADHLQLLSALAMTSRQNDNSQRPLDILWKIVQDDSGCDDVLVEQAKNLISDILGKFFAQELRMGILERCVENVKDHKSVSVSLQLLVKIVEHYPQTTQLESEQERWTVVGHLTNDKGLMKYFFDDIIFFKAESRKFLSNLIGSSEEKSDVVNKNDEAINNSKPFGRMTYIDEIDNRLRFLDALLYHEQIATEQADILWKSFINEALSSTESELGYRWFQQMRNFHNDVPNHIFVNHILQGVDPLLMSPDQYDCFQKYFTEVNVQKEYLQMLESGKNFFVQNYNDLVGLDSLWKVALYGSNERVQKKSIDFLNRVCNRLSHGISDQIGSIRSSILKRCMEELDKGISEFKESNCTSSQVKSQILRILQLVHQFLNASESRGMMGLRPHNALSVGKKWHLTLQDRINFSGYGKPQQYRIAIHENDSLWDLRVVTGAKTNTFPELVKVYFNGTYLYEARNSVSVASLGLRDNCTISVSKKDQEDDRVPLLTAPRGQLVPMARNALSAIFYNYASNEDKTMTREDMSRYIVACGAGASSASLERIQRIFNQHSTRPGPVDSFALEGFLSFYTKAAQDRPEHVWSDLGVFHYRHDLRTEEEARAEEEALLNQKPETLPRYLLAHNEDYFNLLFDKCLNLKDAHVVQAAWDLLLRLPTNPKLREAVETLNDVKVDTKYVAEEWEKVFPSGSLFRLVYNVLIAESLTIDPEHGEKREVLEHRAKWRETFLKKKGFEHLIGILKNFEFKNGYNGNGNDSATQGDRTEVTQQLAVTAVLKMVHSFFVGAIACIPSMEDVVAQIRSLAISGNENEKEKEKEKEEKEKKGDQEEKKQDGKKAGHDKNGSSLDLDNVDQAIYDGESSDDESDEDNDRNFAANLHKEYELEVQKASGMPKEMFEGEPGEQKGEAGEAGEGGESGQVYGPQLPPGHRGSQLSQPGAGGAGDAMELDEVQRYEEKADKDEKEPDVPVPDEDNKASGGSVTTGTDANGANSDAKDEDTKDNANADDAEQKPRTMRQASVQFHELIQQRTGQYSQELINSIDFDSLLLQLLNILKSASAPGTLATQQRDWLVRYAVRLWVSVLLFKPSLLVQLFSVLKKDPTFILAAIQSTDQEIGSEFAKSIRKLCRFVDESPNYTDELKLKLPSVQIVRFFLQDILLANLPKSDQQAEDIDPEQHFYLLISLMQEYTDNHNGSVSEFGSLFEYLVRELKSYTSRETFETIVPDKVLNGLMTLLSVLLAKHAPYRLQAGKSGMMAELFNKFLFATGKSAEDREENLPKCKTFASRVLAFRLIVQMCLDTPQNFGVVLNLVNALQETVSVPKDWDYSPERHVRSQQGYVGLRNLGSTCYMNSLLQQFFMMPHFRHAVVKAGSARAIDLSDDEKKDSLLYQAMRLFSFLSISEKQAYDTREFVASYKDETGKPVDPRIQQDVQEFFNILTDRIEAELKGTEFRHLLKDCFGGKVVNQMICQGGCNTVREREQEFVMISLPIKNRENMKDSLEAYVKAERLEGVTCDTCNKKCDTLKREVLFTLPNTVFFHLKRFELNFETFRHEKSNQRFEFPEEIDLEPFTREGLDRIDKEAKAKQNAEIEVPSKYSEHPQDYYKYVLVGVTVHTGSAEAGHYYSYIKDRKTGVWNEFNDSLIKPFDTKYLDAECFGGKREQNAQSQSWDMYDTDNEKIKNGYILVYDRVKFEKPNHAEEERRRKIEEKKKAREEELKKEKEEEAKAGDGAKGGDNSAVSTSGASGGKAEAKDNNDEPRRIEASVEPVDEDAGREAKQEMDAKDDEEVEPAINVLEYESPETHRVFDGKVAVEMAEDNMKFMRDRQIFNPRYYKFMFDLLQVAPTPESVGDEAYNVPEDQNGGLEAIKMGTFVCFRFLARSQCKNLIINRFVRYLTFLYSKNVGACKWLLTYLASNRVVVVDYILATRDSNVMKLFANLVLNAMITLRKFEEDRLLDEHKIVRDKEDAPDETEEVSVANTCTSRLMDVMIDLIDEAPNHWYRFQQFWRVFEDYADIGPKYRAYLVSRGMIATLGDFYLGAQSPYAKERSKQYIQMGSRLFSAKFDQVIHLISILLRSCHTPATVKRWQQGMSMDAAEHAEERERALTLPHGSLPIKHESGVDTLLVLSERDSKLPHQRLFYNRIIQDSHTNRDILTYTCDIACHWSYEDKSFGGEVAKLVIEGVDRSDLDRVRTYLTIMRRLIEINDGIKQARYQQLFDCNPPDPDDPNQEQQQPNFQSHNRSNQYGITIDILDLIDFYKNEHRTFAYTCIGDIVAVMARDDDFAAFMLQIRDRRWGQSWDLFMDEYCHYRFNYNYQSQEQKKRKEQFYEFYVDTLTTRGVKERDIQRLSTGNNGGNNIMGHMQGHNNYAGGGGMNDPNFDYNGGIQNYNMNQEYFQNGAGLPPAHGDGDDGAGHAPGNSTEDLYNDVDAVNGEGNEADDDDDDEDIHDDDPNDDNDDNDENDENDENDDIGDDAGTGAVEADEADADEEDLVDEAAEDQDAPGEVPSNPVEVPSENRDQYVD